MVKTIPEDRHNVKSNIEAVKILFMFFFSPYISVQYRTTKVLIIVTVQSYRRKFCTVSNISVENLKEKRGD